MKVLNICILVLLFCTFKGTAYATESVLPGTLIKSGYVDNASYGPFNIGFNFTFFGNTYSQFYVNSNGQVLFGAGSTVFNDAAIPTAALPNNFIAAFWDDLVVDGSGKILYTTIGGSPNRKLIIQFNNMGFYGSPPYMGTFAVIINETTNVIQVQYRLIVDNTSTQAHGASASIGLENSDGTIGVQYLFHTEGDIHSGKAISFTPSGSTYTTNSDALYEEVFLTTNITLPEPGIPTLLNPPQDAEISPDFTFSWSDAGNTSSYALLIANNSALAGATYYDAGTNLSYDVTGLTVDATYYWGVFATNATGSTWCEIKKFIVRENPPLIAVAQTIKVEQNHEKSIQLQYAGGDASAKTAIITSLPANGHLYQYNAGVKGALISSVPTNITDAGRNVIYLADGSFGNGAGNFKYKMHDDTGDSPEALITVNVSPPGIPNLLYVAKNTGIEMQFDRAMANPAGKENQFTVTVNSTPIAITSLSIKTGDTYTIIGTLATPLITGTEAVTIAYTAGDVASAQGGWLDSFNAQIVTLKAQTITFNTNLNRKINELTFTLSATASSGLSITFSSSDLSIATIIGNTVTLHSTGTCIITARQAGNSTWAQANFDSTLTVSKGDQTITFDALANKTIGDPDFALTATASSGLSVTFASNNSAVATVAGNMVHIVGAGTTTITASQAGNSLWNPATDVPQTLTVNKADQTITFSAIPVKTYGDADFTLTASASSGLSVSYTSDNPSVATVAGNIVHITGVGLAVITASQPGNTNYNPASDVPQTLTVDKADQTITFGTLPDKVYGDADFAPGASSSSGLTISYASSNSAVATITGGMIHITGAGTSTITASQAGDANYNAAIDVQQSLTVEINPTHKDIMNLFTPNNDGYNDLWELPQMEEWGRCEVRLFSRSGKLVFADDDYDNTWDGTMDGNPVPEGPYYYVIKTENAGTIKGTLNLVR